MFESGAKIPDIVEKDEPLGKEEAVQFKNDNELDGQAPHDPK